MLCCVASEQDRALANCSVEISHWVGGPLARPETNIKSIQPFQVNGVDYENPAKEDWFGNPYSWASSVTGGGGQSLNFPPPPLNPTITRHRQSDVYESINATTVGALPTQPLPSILRNAAIANSSRVRLLFRNLFVQRRVQNYEPRGTIFFLSPDGEDMIKECKFEGHLGPIGPVFHAKIHIKESQARLLKAYGVWSKRSPLCKFFFILVVHIMFQTNHHKSHA